MRILLLTVLLLLASCGQNGNNKSVVQPQNEQSASIEAEDDHTLPKNPPSKADAEQWYKEFRAAKDKVFDGMFINKIEEHRDFNLHITNLAHRAEELFGAPMTSKLSFCTISAYALMTAWQTSAEIMRTGDLERNPPNNIALMAWSGGEKYQTCLDTMDLLK